jgi:ATP-dependent RNA helicase DeaD
MSNIKFEKIMIPSATEVRDKKLLAFTDTILNTEVEEHIFDTQVQKAVDILMEADHKELVQKILSLELRRFSVDFMNEPDLNASGSDRGTRGDRPERGEGGRERDGGFGGRSRGNRIFVSLGKKDGFDIRSFKDWVADSAGVSWKDLHVDVSGVYSFVDSGAEHSDAIIKSLNGKEFNGRTVRAELSGDKSSAGGERRSSYGGGERRSGGRSEGGFGGGERRSSYGGGERRSGGGRSEGGFGGERRSSSSSYGERRSSGGGERPEGSFRRRESSGGDSGGIRRRRNS